jgi:hypothetical protein
MNLHGTVRGAIRSVNPDIPVSWLVSQAPTVNAAGKLSPSYAAPVSITAQVQPVKGSDLQKFNFLQGQGIFRVAYLFGNAQGIVRVDAKGGDLLKFPQSQAAGSPVQTWLVRVVDETWTMDASAGGWCRVIVELQLDPNNP